MLKQIVKLKLTIQNPAHYLDIPNKAEMRRWIICALQDKVNHATITVRVVNPHESQMLNERYRKKNNPTNILSFAYDIEDNQARGQLEGDLVICAEIVAKEALEQQKPIIAHWAHLIVHGILHLIGLDHESEKEAKYMESLEILLLAQLGYRNPYAQNLGENHV